MSVPLVISMVEWLFVGLVWNNEYDDEWYFYNIKIS